MDPNTENQQPENQEVPETEPDIIAGMDEAIAGADDAPTPEPEPEEQPEVEPEVEPETEGEPEPQPDDEADKLGLKDRAKERFESLSGQVKELAPLKAALEEAGIKDIKTLPQLVERAQAADQFIGMVQDTGATAEQYGQALDYLRLVNAAGSGDRKAAEQAYAVMEAEMRVLAQALGKEVPGIHDPLSEFPDIARKVENCEIDRQTALELAGARAGQRMSQYGQQQKEQRRQTEQQTQQQIQGGVNALVAWDRAKMQADPNYKDIRPILDAKVAEIRTKYPPSQWAEITELAYQAIAAQHKPAPRKPPVSAIRPGNAGRPLTPTTFDNPMDAMNAALESVK